MASKQKQSSIAPASAPKKSIGRRWGDFFERQLWQPASSTAGRAMRWVVRRIYLAARIFIREFMSYRAASITYSFVFAVVPILAILFAIAKGFGLAEFLEEQIRTTFVAQPEVIDTLLGFVERYLNRSKGGIFLGFGIVLLLYTLYFLAEKVEVTFNQIWQVKRERSFWRKLSDYSALFFLFPICLIVSSGISLYLNEFVVRLPDVFYLHSSLLTLLKGLPFVLMVLFCAILFYAMPNTRVSWRSAFVAGVPTGLVLQTFLFLYVRLQVYLTSYNAVYGSFAALPLLMLCCLIAWYIVLFGCCLCFVDQKGELFYFGEDQPELSRSELDRQCLRVAGEVSRCFKSGSASPTSASHLESALTLPPAVVSQCADRLVKAGILCESVGMSGRSKRTGYLPAAPTSQMSVAAVLSALDAAGLTLEDVPESKEYADFRARLYAGNFAQKLVSEIH